MPPDESATKNPNPSLLFSVDTIVYGTLRVSSVEVAPSKMPLKLVVNNVFTVAFGDGGVPGLSADL